MTRATLTAALMMGISSLAFAQTPPAATRPATPNKTVDAPATSPAIPVPGKAVDAATPAVKATPTPTPAAAAGLPQQLTAKLEAAGFTDVKVIPESFLVHAKDKAGTEVRIFVEHDAMMVFNTADAVAPGAAVGGSGMFTDIPANEDLSSKLVGLDIYSADKQKIGTIKDIAFGNQGVRAYIVSVGGFLGMGEHYVAVRPSAIKIDLGATDKKLHATMQTTAAELKAAPEYKYDSTS